MSRKNNVNRYKGYLLSFLMLQLHLMLCFAIFTSCATNQETTDKTQETTKINICVKNKVPNDITRTVSDESINDINVFIFDNDGFLIGHKYSSGTSTYVNTRIANSCKVCVIANYSNDINNISTYNGLKKMITTIGSATDISNKTTEMMYGEQSTSISNTTSTISIILKHLYSKYTFTITPSSGVTITGYQLCHVSNISYLVEDGTMGNPSSAYLDFGNVVSSSTSSFTTGQYYIYENYPGANKNNIGNAKDRNSLNAPSNASYLKITAKSTSNNNPWNSTYYIYLGGVKETDISDFNIPRDYNFSYTINITGSGYNDARVSFTAGLMTSTTNGQWNSGGNSTVASNFDGPVNIGEYYFTDGTWGTLADHATSNIKPIALIFSKTTSSIDQGYGWKHGYAIALKDAYEGTLDWCSSIYANTLEMGRTYTDISSVKNDLEGYTHTNTIITKSTNLLTDYPAFYYAYNYKNTVTPPINSSGWFLASIGQYYLFSIGPCKISTSTYYLSPDYYIKGWAWLRNDGGTLNSSFVSRDNFNSYLIAAANAGANVDKVLCGTSDCPNWVDSWYDSSSEYSSTNYFFLLFGANGDLMYDHRRLKNTSDNIRVCIRPVIAF